MTYVLKTELFTVLITLLTLFYLFGAESVFAETTVKNRIEINGKVYVDDTQSADGPIDTDIDVDVKNDTGIVKYKVNGEEKVIQITPGKSTNTSNSSKPELEDDIDESEENEDDEDEDTDKINVLKNKSKVKVQGSSSLIQKMMEVLDSFFSRIEALFTKRQ